MKEKPHWIAKSAMGSFCTKCHNWSNTTTGLKDEVCLGTRKQYKENKKLRNKLYDKKQQ